jgi:hypothetical protein
MEQTMIQMGWHERVFLIGFDLLSLVPLLLSLLVFRWQHGHFFDPGWRPRVTSIGLVSATLAAIPLPLFFLSLYALPSSAKTTWLPQASADSIQAGILAAAVAIPMLACSQGKARWVGLASAALSLSMLFVSLLSLSD